MSVTTGHCCCAFNGHHPGGGFVTTRTGDEIKPEAERYREPGDGRYDGKDEGSCCGIRLHRSLTPPVLHAHRDIPIMQLYGDIFI